MQENTKQVIVKMTARRAFRTEPIWQYDTGHELVFEGFDGLPATFQVHFSLSPMGQSITQVGQNGVCTLPDMYTRTAAPIYAWLYIAETDTGLTKYSIEIPVQRRAAITNQQPTPVEESAIDQAIAALNAAVTQTGEDVTAAGASAAAAARSASDASDSATAASRSATAAYNSAVDANSSREYADQSASNAGASERAAAASARDAATAKGKAEDAQAAAEAAVASYDAMTATATTLSPGSSATAEIDRTGDHPVLQLGLPQGATGATPDFSIGTVSTLQPGQDATATITGTAAAPVLNLGIPKGNPGDATIDDTAGAGDVTKVWSADKTAGEVDSLKSAIDSKAPVIVNTASGSIASFNDGADGMPIKGMTVGIEPVQSGSGDPAPDNVRPITGWTGATVEHRGHNWANIYGYSATSLASPESTRVTSNAYGTTISSTNYTEGTAITVTQTNHSASTATAYQNGFFVVGVRGLINGKRYGFRAKINVTSNPLNVNSTILLRNGGTAVVLTINNGYIYGAFTYVTENNKQYLEIRCAGMSFTLSEIMVTLIADGSSDVDLSADYVPYSGNTYPITFPSEAGTVYGGSLTVNEDGTGQLVVDRTVVAYDGSSDEVWVRNSNNEYYIQNNNVAKLGDYRGRIACDKLSTYKVASAGSSNYGITGYSPVGYPGQNWIYVFLTSSYPENATGLKAWLAENPITVCYPLATPLTYSLTATQITTLLGSNRIWADCGAVSVDYCADTKAYVDNAAPEAPVQDVQVDGTSVVQNGVANIPLAGPGVPGVVIIDGYGLTKKANEPYKNTLQIAGASESQIKNANSYVSPIVPGKQHMSVFYGLASAAGDSTQSASSNAVGSYTESAKSAISTMLNGSVSVSGTTPSITALPGVRYVCGEVATLDVTVPASGIIDVVFESGSTATVLTITGTVKWANGFDPTSLDANTTYEINIADGLGVAASWT